MRLWLGALGRTIAQTSWLWGSMILDDLGYHRAASLVVVFAAGVIARILWEHYLEFRVWRRKFIAWRRERRRDGS